MPKSSTFTVPSGFSLMFGGLEVAVHDAALVRGLERVGDLCRDAQRLVDRDRPLRDPLDERRPVDELHDDARVGRRCARDHRYERCSSG